ncbi:type I restriction enzyme specificity protein [Burkholderia pseudomallei]|nr:type I restriction enzyme specificity protein [Burkholderia pseudomallei]
MSLPQYAKYKDSGVPWLGQVPTHWLVQRLKEVIAFIESGVSVNAIDTPAGEGEPGVLKTSCVYSGEFTPSENKLVVPEELGLTCPGIFGPVET